MRHIILPIILTVLVAHLSSCSTEFVRSYTKDSKKNVLLRESMLRYDDKQLKSVAGNGKGMKALAAKCHLQNYEEALTEFKKGLKKNEKNPEYWNHIGNCYFLKGESAKAAFYYDLSIETSASLKRPYAPAHNNRGVLYFKKRFYQEALDSFRSASSLAPQLLTPRFNLAHIYLKFGLLSKAHAEIRRLKAANSEDTDLLFLMGSLALVENRIKDAIAYFERIDSKHRDRQDISNHYALALYLAGNYEKAKDVMSDQKKIDIHHLNVMGRQLRELIDNKLRSQG